MGMSIDKAEALEILKDIRLNANYMQNRESRTGMACKLAIETMCKYQKIEQILKEISYGGDATVWRIQEVAEDGTN